MASTTSLWIGSQVRPLASSQAPERAKVAESPRSVSIDLNLVIVAGWLRVRTFRRFVTSTRRCFAFHCSLRAERPRPSRGAAFGAEGEKAGGRSSMPSSRSVEERQPCSAS